MRTGLLSNTHWPRARHEWWLRGAGLLDLLHAVGVDPGRAVFVGDRLCDDVSGAQALGMLTEHLTGPVEGWDVVPDAGLVTLDGLVELVDRWR